MLRTAVQIQPNQGRWCSLVARSRANLYITQSQKTPKKTKKMNTKDEKGWSVDLFCSPSIGHPPRYYPSNNTGEAQNWKWIEHKGFIDVMLTSKELHVEVWSVCTHRRKESARQQEDIWSVELWPESGRLTRNGIWCLMLLLFLRWVDKKSAG